MVKEIFLDCACLTDRDSAHGYLAAAFDFPPYYGRNLDALYDCLSELGPCQVTVTGADALRRQGGYGARILDTLTSAAAGDPNIQLLFDPAPAE